MAGRTARMKQFTSIELCGLALGAVLFFVGLATIIWPRAGVVPHFTNGPRGMHYRAGGLSGEKMSCGKLRPGYALHLTAASYLLHPARLVAAVAELGSITP
jgi:hypothetical protein